MKSIYLHIGTHKTGSTSLQRWFSEHERFLKQNGYGLYKGHHSRNNHIELYLAAMRYDRDSFGKQSMTQVKFDESYTAFVSERVQTFIARCKEDRLILTTEGLSLLRHTDELQRLKEILGPACEIARVIVVLRNKRDFLKSYRLQLRKRKGRTPSTDYWSALYVEDDTWLTDYEQLINAYGIAFGFSTIAVIDYDNEMKTVGNILPSVLESIGLEVDLEHTRSFNRYRYNATVGLRARRARLVNRIRRFRRRVVCFLRRRGLLSRFAGTE